MQIGGLGREGQHSSFGAAGPWVNSDGQLKTGHPVGLQQDQLQFE
jgi:hypothetical protein